MGVGELEKGMEWIGRSIEQRDPVTVTSLKITPTYDLLRSHPLYLALLRKMNLEPSAQY
jgi:hypothetical protein